MLTMDTIQVFSQRLAGWLMFKGAPLIEIRQNKKDTQFNTFIFRKTGGVSRAITQYNNRGKGILDKIGSIDTESANTYNKAQRTVAEH